MKLFRYIKYFFRKRLKIPSDFAYNTIKDLHYSVSDKNISNYNEVTSIFSVENNQDFIHPLFFTQISWKIIKNLNEFLEEKINPDILNTIVHQSEHIKIHTYKKKFSNLNVKSEITEISKHKKGTKLFIKFEYYSKNIHIATEYSSGILFGVKLTGENIITKKNFQTENINTEAVWIKSIKIDEKLPYEYAKKANIDAPIHTNPKFAKSIGLKGIVLQGTCTFAKAISLIVAEEFNNDFSKIKEVYARFTNIVYPYNELNLRLLKLDEKIANFDIINTKGKKVLKGGTITLK